MTKFSDKEILKLYFEDDNKNYAFNLLVQKHQQKLYYHIRRIVINHDDTNDVLQNTLIKVWGNLKLFKQDAKLYTWLYRIATNEAITFLNKKRKKFFIPLVNVENQLSQSLESDNYFSGDEIQLKLQKALLTLPEKQRLVFNMKYFEELKYTEISDIMGTSVGALKASYHLAVKKIEKIVVQD